MTFFIIYREMNTAMVMGAKSRPKITYLLPNYVPPSLINKGKLLKNIHNDNF